jgi:flagellar FliL protein
MTRIIILVVALLAVAGGGLYFTGMLDSLLGGDEAAAGESVEVPRVATYMPLDPPFVVNFTHRGALRYLQLSVELMFYDAMRLDLARQRMPAIRNDVIILLSGKDFDSLSTIESKELLRREILAAVCKVLELDVEAVVAGDEGTIYITNFIMQ